MNAPAQSVLTVRSNRSEVSFAPGGDVIIGSDVRADLRVAHPLVTRAHLVLRFDHGKWVAVDNNSRSGIFVDGRRVPGRAVIEICCSRCLPLIAKPTSRTSSPPVLVATSWRRASRPAVNTRSTLPIVTTSPSVSRACAIRTPLTNVPLMLFASRISMPAGVGSRNA